MHRLNHRMKKQTYPVTRYLEFYVNAIKLQWQLAKRCTKSIIANRNSGATSRVINVPNRAADLSNYEYRVI